jgi:hypothetical protein
MLLIHEETPVITQDLLRILISSLEREESTIGSVSARDLASIAKEGTFNSESCS